MKNSNILLDKWAWIFLGIFIALLIPVIRGIFFLISPAVAIVIAFLGKNNPPDGVLIVLYCFFSGFLFYGYHRWFLFARQFTGKKAWASWASFVLGIFAINLMSCIYLAYKMMDLVG